jgi:DNA-binding CsgD family transcriptional regulator
MQPAFVYTLEEAVRKLRGTLYEIAVGLNANIASLSQTCEIAFKKYDLSNVR